MIDRPKMRFVLILFAIALYALAIGFCFQWRWATALWPFKLGYAYAASSESLSFLIVGAILASGGTSVLWCALARDFRAMVGVGIDATVTTLAAAIIMLTSGRPMFDLPAGIALLLSLGGVGTVIYFHRDKFRDERPTPTGARIAFAIFIAALSFGGGAMALGSVRVLPWDVSSDVARVYGWVFIGVASYFLYALLVPVWSNAVGQLLAFLTYDLVLIGPFVRFFAEVRPERRLNLSLYLALLCISAIVAIYYCFINRSTRINRDKSARTG